MSMDILPFRSEVLTLTPVASGDFTPWVSPEKQVVKMGVIVQTTINAPLDGSYDLIVETGPEEGDGATQTGDQILVIEEAGTFRLQFSNPILDRVRLRVQTDALTPSNITFAVIFVADRQINL